MNEDVSSPPHKRMKRCEVKQLNQAMTEYELYVVRSKSKPITFWLVDDWNDKEPKRIMTISPRKQHKDSSPIETQENPRKPNGTQ